MDKTYFNRTKPELSSFEKKIFINQCGYKTSSVKKAILTDGAEKFLIKNSSGELCFEGMTSHFGIDENSGDDVYIADFSMLTTAGTYRMETDKGSLSLWFTIDDNCYKKVFDDVSKAFYYLRCGCGLDAVHAGKFAHDKCHNGEAVLWGDSSVRADVSGGWHDAGDYGRYVTAGACALGHILAAFKMFPQVFEEQNLNIPESDMPIPDMISECRTELEWILKMQRDDGGVYHKATTALHAPFIMPEDDKEQMYLFDVSSMAAADSAAIFAMAAGIYRKYDPEFADRLTDAAEKSYDWLRNNPDFIGFHNPEGCNTGGYGEGGDKDNRFWAAAEMYCLTDDEQYLTDAEKLLENEFPLTALGYGSIAGLGALAFLLNEKTKDTELGRKFAAEFIKAAEMLAEKADNCGYGAAMSTNDYCWGSNMNILKHSMIFIIADYIENGSRFAAYTSAQLDYLLGVNATGYSYVTGNGAFCCNYPHLRPAHADGIEECIPGMVSGGPNRYPCDHDARILVPEGTPPMKCYADDVGCYSLNEITIYWNSPAVFLLAYMQR